MTKDVNTIRGRLIHARKLAGYEQGEMRALLADHGIKLSQSGYRRLETVEATKPNLELIQVFASITGTTPGWLLFGGVDEPMIADKAVTMRRAIIDTIEKMGTVLSMTKRQRNSFEKLIQSLRDNS